VLKFHAITKESFLVKVITMGIVMAVAGITVIMVSAGTAEVAEASINQRGVRTLRNLACVFKSITNSKIFHRWILISVFVEGLK